MAIHLAVMKVWGVCSDCGYEGMLEYRHLDDEDYADAESLGVMLMQRCPACETSDHALIPMDYYREMLDAQLPEASGEE